MAQKFSDDLFEGTKMTFGEHLEELRICLFRAIVGLILGFLIGLAVAKPVVRWIQTPLKHALEEHYVQRTQIKLKRQFANVPPNIAEFIEEHRLTYDEAFLERSDIQRISEHVRSETAASDQELEVELNRKLSVPDVTDLTKVRIWRPLDPRITTLNAQEAFMIWLKAAFASGLILASPYIFWQLWIFVAAGLYPHEKRYVYLFLPISMGLFWSGAALAFFAVFRYVLTFLLGFNTAMEIHSEPRLNEWISFALILPLGFGVAFQLPLVMLFLQRIGIISIEAYLSKWRVAVLAICVISMFLTPADPISMLLMAVPLTGLYFLGVGFCKWMPRGRSPFAEAYEP